jgi:hypothetical protein
MSPVPKGPREQSRRHGRTASLSVRQLPNVALALGSGMQTTRADDERTIRLWRSVSTPDAGALAGLP